MRVKVKEHSHQYYAEYRGVVLGWSTTVEMFAKQYMQVPAIILETKSGVKVISLGRECYWTEIEKLKENEDV